MLIFDEQDSLVTNPDLNIGHIIIEDKKVFHTYVVDVPEKGRFEQIAYYPETGGSDVRWVVDTPEEGHWETKNENGDLITNYDGAIADDWVKESTVEETWQLQRYKLYTEDELAEIAEQKSRAEEAQAKATEREAYLKEAPIIQEEVLEGLAEVGNLAAESAASVDELMDAMVELAGIVAASVEQEG